MLVFKFILLILSVFAGYSLGYLMTETKYRLGQWRFFQFKAFECRKCLSTHIAWVTSTFAALCLSDWIMLGVGLVFAAVLFVGLYVDEKNRTINIK